MEVEIRGFKGVLLELQSTIAIRSSFDTPRVAYYEVKLYNSDKKVKISLEKVYPEEINIIKKENK